MLLNFLKKFGDKYHIQLSAIDPNGVSAIQTQTFLPDEYATTCLAFVEKWNGTRNLYFTVNPLKAPLNKKPTLADIGQLRWLHVDIDPEDGANWEKSREDILSRLKSYSPAPTMIIDSGNGYQGFWQLEKPILVNNVSHGQDLAGYNIALRDDLQGDNVQDISRIMRLPYTTNVPNVKKIAKGRTSRPTELIYYHEQIQYPLNKFRLVKDSSKAVLPNKSDINFANLPDVNLSEFEINEEVKEAILTGNRAKDPSRSETVMFVGCALAKAGAEREQVASILLNSNYGISDSILSSPSPNSYCLRQVDRCFDLSVNAELAELNQKYSFVMDGGKVRIFKSSYSDILRRESLERIAVSDFKYMYNNRQVSVGKKKDGSHQKMPLGSWWLQHPARKTYKQIIFDPTSETHNGCYNLWKGFNVEQHEKENGWDLMQQHILNNICSGVTEYYEYLINWMALCVQQPGKPGQVAIVMRGEQGTGKGILARSFGHIWGQHFLHISHTRHLTGNFNAHLRDCIFLFADEAFWAGDKQGEGALKQLVTEPILTIEAKGIDPVAAPNFIHLMMASNHEWVIPAGRMERRFFVLDVSSKKIQQRDYFKRISDQMESGGYEAMLHDLMCKDLTSFDVTRVPQTKALAEQKEISMEPHEQWLFQCLQSGQTLPEHGGWHDEVELDRLYEEYLVMCENIGVKRRKNKIHFGKFMKKIFPRMTKVQKIIKKRMRREGNIIECKATMYCLPNLESARKYFEVYTGAQHTWDNADQVQGFVGSYNNYNGAGHND